MSDRVNVWTETVSFPTYAVGIPDKNPMFLERRVYQGSSGVVYPHPVIDRIENEKRDQPYAAVFLENRFLKIMLLPEIGGRLHMAFDKTNGYHFIYFNRVIKPALVGLTGPWISGGIEFNWPQHHRPSTFQPIDWTIETGTDGSMTVWMGEIERMTRTKGMTGFTLYPDRAYLEIRAQLYNRTREPQSFLWWMNPAIHVNDDYQAIFPPDVRAVMDHGKRDVVSFPIARGTYYKVDYSPGTDISRYRNIPVPTSYMAEHSDYDFLGAYDHGKQAGTMLLSDHHIATGKKQWTWGSGEFGKAWDRELTDEDGPYTELMFGMYTDNQPDFSWIQPGEEKRFTAWLLPYKAIGGAKNANRDVIVNLDVSGLTACIGVYVSQQRMVRIQLRQNADVVFEQDADLSPENAFTHSVLLAQTASPDRFTLAVLDGERELIRFTPPMDETFVMPEPASAAKAPEAIASNDELYLNGLHLEQYRHATYLPEDYYLEALRRDPLDSRCNNAMGLLLYRRGKFAEAETCFRTAIRSLTRRNPNPYTNEPFYNLGLALTMQGQYAEAFDAFYKAIWDAACQDRGYFEMARLAAREGRYEDALDFAERTLVRNAHHHAARHLKIVLLRHLGHTADAEHEAAAALALDPLNFGAHFEHYLLTGDTTYRTLMRDNPHTYIEISMDYARAGRFAEAVAMLQDAPPADPMVGYTLGWYHAQAGDDAAANAAFVQAAGISPTYCFPNQIECITALECAMQHQQDNARAPYYLGNFWYAHRRYAEAIACWERARSLDPTFPTVHRNLGLAYLNKEGDADKALAAYQQAFVLDPADARVFFELDQLHKRLNEAPAERLIRLEQHIELVEQRDDLMIEYAAVLNLLGRHDRALDILLSRRFHPWEGGEGKVTGQYVASLVELAKARLEQRDYAGALALLERARNYPQNLGEGRLYSVRENHIDYYLGCAYEGLGDADDARRHFVEATIGSDEPTLPLYYNDQPPEMIFFQGMAHLKLGKTEAARTTFEKLIDYGMAHLDDHLRIDYFAVSLPAMVASDEDLDHLNQAHCHYLIALGSQGLGDVKQAHAHFDAVLALDRYHFGATVWQASLPTM